MTPTATMTRYCGGKTRAGGLCRREAGWGTNHVGAGKCKLHGGSAPSGETAGNRELALAYASERMGTSDLAPTDAMLMCVRDTAAFVSYCKRQVADLDEGKLIVKGELTAWARLQRQGTQDLAKFSKMALDANVAERQVRLAERMGELLAGAMEEVLDALGLDAKQRAKAVKVYGGALARLEAGDVVEGTTA
jgi:hypothetical protein